MDLEGYAAHLIQNEENDVQLKLKEKIIELKKCCGQDEADILAAAILEETKSALFVKGDVFEYQKSGASMGEFGIGSRGAGDFYVHEKIGKVIGKTTAVLDSSNMDDSGVVALAGGTNSGGTNSGGTNSDGANSGSADGADSPDYLVVTVDGMHSRLSAFPFLSGFHVAKAALRDIYVMGAKPAAMLSDIHVADDGDAAMIFDHLAGISAVAELSGIPLVTGSTLRIGGDMVIGKRMTGCVGAVGAVNAGSLTARNNAKSGDLILMTEGTGGGTVTTAAIYSGYEKAAEVVEKTLNIDFLIAVQALLDSKEKLHTQIHVMTDVTNGGVRGDAYEISKEANIRLVFDDGALVQCVEPTVLEMFEKLEIDFRGVSIDSLLVICPPEIAENVIQTVNGAGVKMFVVGRVEEKQTGKFDTALMIDGAEKEFKPMFREAAYTPIKKVIGERTPPDFEEMKKGIDAAADSAIEKKERIVKRIQNRK
ncbi:Thiamine-monophosphate kinase [Methanimicrococcus hongohii]|uniref:Thiamine-monophosphate kinase n=1 Tax=Methanimicrococcus hongohii TaxID=3028295 RepID=A0AA96V850_9EURY|nr:AIR synthase-related protein [Methanimicrococcus sp. Hf6]WNY23251.1 Thiamine-monophosphate kinase [Methanimicrococcus sp. Hf6]